MAEIVIDISKATARRMATVAVTLLLVSVPLAVVAVPKTFTKNTVLTAEDLNANFADLEAQISDLTEGGVPRVTAWEAYSSSVSAITTPVTTTTTARWRRVGDSVEIRITSDFATCAASGQLRWTLPPGVIADVAKLPDWNALVGDGSFVNTGSNPYSLTDLVLLAQGTNGFVVPDLSTTDQAGGLTCAQLGDGPRTVRLAFSLPVEGWSPTR